MSQQATIETTFEVIDEELSTLSDTTPPAKRGRGRPRKERDGQDAEGAADEVAQLMEEMASEAARLATLNAMKEAKRLKDETLAEVDAHCRKISEQYSKPKNLCMHIKLGDLPAVKLKTRVAKILPDLLAQCKIGQVGGNWPLLFGPTGCGKTVAAEQVADSLKLSFDHVNCSEGMSETWLWGRQTPQGFIPGGLWKAFKEGGVFLFDEADAANDNVWLSINTMLANGHAHNPISGEAVKRHPNFIAIAAANTNGKGGTGAYTGRTRLDGATLNRFTMFEVEYDRDLEQELCADNPLREKLWKIREELNKKQSADVVSTRDMKNAMMQLQAGFPVQKILDCLARRMDKANKTLFVD